MVEQLAAEETTVLLTTQYLEEADRLADPRGGDRPRPGGGRTHPEQLKDKVGAASLVLRLTDAAACDDALAVLVARRRRAGASRRCHRPVPGASYIQFVVPGFWVQTVLFASGHTGTALAEETSSGILDRFRSLPMARSAYLGGRVVADATRNAFVLALVTTVGSVAGFRFRGGLAGGLAALLLVAAFGAAFRLRAPRHHAGVGRGGGPRQPGHLRGQRGACIVARPPARRPRRGHRRLDRRSARGVLSR